MLVDWQRLKDTKFLSHRVCLQSSHLNFEKKILSHQKIVNFVEITLSSTVLRDISISVICNFEKNSKIQNGRQNSAEIP